MPKINVITATGKDGRFEYSFELTNKGCYFNMSKGKGDPSDVKTYWRLKFDIALLKKGVKKEEIKEKLRVEVNKQRDVKKESVVLTFGELEIEVYYAQLYWAEKAAQEI
jgi:hypothetical protein